MGKIYKITNLLNGKMYIGQTCRTLAIRMSQHKYDSTHSDAFNYKSILYKAFRKYGFENFIIEEIEDIPNNLLNEREKYWSDYFDTYNSGYNATLGGDNGNFKYTDEEILEAWNDCYTIEEMSSYLHCDRHTISHRLSNLIPNYEAKLHSKLLQKNKKQRQNVVLAAQQMWRQGYTPQEIYQTLDINKRGSKKYIQQDNTYSNEERKAHLLKTKIQNNTQKKAIYAESKDHLLLIFESISEAVRFLGDVAKASNISACLRRKQKTAYGYKWYYKEATNG